MILHKINIKPLSINQASKGRRFKTPKYTKFEYDLLLILPKSIYIPKDKIKLIFEVGYSNAGADIDNFAKVTIDVLQKKYGFNDNKIYKLEIEKFVVKKGEEFIAFKFLDYF
jgi:Holliday junction resolvase RusA-like endonuclease